MGVIFPSSSYCPSSCLGLSSMFRDGTNHIIPLFILSAHVGVVVAVDLMYILLLAVTVEQIKPVSLSVSLPSCRYCLNFNLLPTSMYTPHLRFSH